VKSGEVKRLWGEPKSYQDIYDVFAKYCSGEVEQLPWIDRALSPESDSIKPLLIKLNKNGFLTINSQPAVNGVSSTDEVFGWGPANGYIYQKAYLEFFTSAENLQRLIAAMKKFPSMTYHATTRKGDSLANTPEHSVSAITWGVFPGKEILQPTVVDSDSFMVWKDEAFVLWDSQWAAHYEEGSESRKLLQNVIDTYYLVNVVDNNYINGNIFALFEYLISGDISVNIVVINNIHKIISINHVLQQLA
jgi:methylenetetrahydrofolate reductase (NADPH)